MSARGGRREPRGPDPSAKEPPLPPPLPEGQAIPLGVRPFRWFHHARASIVLLVLVVLVGSILYPLAVTGIALLITPDTARGLPFVGQNQTLPGQNNTTANATPAHGGWVVGVGVRAGESPLGRWACIPAMRGTGSPSAGERSVAGGALISGDRSGEG